MKRIAIFAHYDKNNLIEEYVIYYLKNLKNICESVIFVSDNDLDEQECAKIKPFADVILAEHHREYDFGSYKRGFFLAKKEGLLKDTDELIFCNDSCYASLFPFDKIFETMKAKGANFWGNTANYHPTLHLQSYFLVFEKKVFNSKIFIEFMSNITKEKTKEDVIRKYEIGLTLELQKQFSWDCYCQKYEKIAGPHIKKYKELILEDKSPFLKTSIIRLKEYKNVFSFGWEKLIKNHTEYNYKFIEEDLKNNLQENWLKNLILFKIFLFIYFLKTLRRKVIRIWFKQRAICLCGHWYKLRKGDNNYEN